MLNMRQQHQLFTISICYCSVFIALVSAVPLPANNQELDVLQIPLSDGKELDVLTLSAKDQEQIIAERNKRTIGLLRELFPDITKQIDDQVNSIISKVLRTLGPTILRTAVQGNTANRARTDFDADFDDDDDDDDNNKTINSDSNSNSTTESISNSNESNTQVEIELPTFEPDGKDETK